MVWQFNCDLCGNAALLTTLRFLLPRRRVCCPNAGREAGARVAPLETAINTTFEVYELADGCADARVELPGLAAGTGSA